MIALAIILCVVLMLLGFEALNAASDPTYEHLPQQRQAIIGFALICFLVSFGLITYVTSENGVPAIASVITKHY